MYKTIVIPVEISHLDRGKSMIDIAKAHASSDSKIILLHVIDTVPAWVAAEMPSGFLEKSRLSIQDELQAVADAASVEADVEIHSGHPYKTILEKSRELKADLIIIASHKPGLQDYFLGSTAAKVVRHADCSVLVVR